LKNKNYSILHPIVLFFTLGVAVLIGWIVALLVEPIRYTQYLPPWQYEISPTKARAEMTQSSSDNTLFIDVRSPKEYNELHAEGSINIPIADLYDKWKNELPREGKDIYLICTSGRLASVAYGYLQIHGFTNLKHIEGGVSNWVSEKQPTVSKKIRW
jgi:rhodanese-related sulfurtransferase